jgi:membrane protease YdiL (CAAX protease family)
MKQRWKEAGLIALALVAVGLAFVGVSLVTGNSSESVQLIVLGLVCLVAYLAAVRWIERRVPRELSLHHALPVLAAGMLGGIALFSLVMTVEWLAGAYHPAGWGSFSGLGLGLAVALGIAFQEEILFRGLLFRLCSKIFGTWAGLVLSALLFGAAHMGAGATLASWLVIAITGGVLLGAAYAATGRLWLPLGLHAGFDFADDSIFGHPVSGHQTASGLIAGRLQGPDILAGGSWGPDASIVTVIICLVAAACLLWRVVKLRRAQPPIWSNVSTAGAAGL